MENKNTTIPIIPVVGPDFQLSDFRKHISSETPVVLTNLFALIPNLANLSFPFLSQYLRDAPVPISFADHRAALPFSQYYADFAHYRTLQTVPYMSDWNYSEAFPEVLQMVSPLPEIFEKWPQQSPPTKMPYTFGFIGPKGVKSPLHTDDHSTHGWLMQVVGRKECKLWGPKMFPWRHYEPLVVVLNAGEMLYIPLRWGHEMVALEDSISIQWMHICDECPEKTKK
eukprot:TRINITY_DN26743_c0_g1_i1.p1 TRINITY_DN26743_c0_g1~~TRINITY_DN26743_c0_g1_i1.p1  ORF type:complete len:226 (+),score=21.62 TRINITY_DN26743_c0_g1_i1:72-749(+)